MYSLKQRNNVFLSNCKAATICNVCKFKCNQNMHANKPLVLIYSLFTNIRSVCISDHFWIWKTITEAKIGKHLLSVHTAGGYGHSLTPRLKGKLVMSFGEHHCFAPQDAQRWFHRWSWIPLIWVQRLEIFLLFILVGYCKPSQKPFKSKILCLSRFWFELCNPMCY